MHVYPFNIKTRGRLRWAIFLLSMMAALNGSAQDSGKLPDSVNTSDVVQAPKTDSTVGALPESDGQGSGSQAIVTPPTDSVVLRSVPDSVISRYQKDEDFAYANDPEYWKTDTVRAEEPSKASPDSGRGWRLLLLFIVLGGALLLILYGFMTENSLRFFYKASRKTSKGPGDGEGEIQDDDLDKKIGEALQAKDHRMSTRYLFLKTLRLLEERQLIRYQAKATNQDYVREMGTHEAGPRFSLLADAYDHVWYGDFSLNDQQFGRLLNYFEDFYKTLSY